LALTTLKSRSEFLAVRGGLRASVPVCLLEAKPRQPAQSSVYTGPRFGFTVTKKLGGAVIRNRIRRRLKAAIEQLASLEAKDGHDYVVVARQAAYDRPFADMLADLTRAFRGVHKPQGERQQRLDKHSNTMKKPDRRGHA
jgi:ribonuclease P protein component